MTYATFVFITPPQHDSMAIVYSAGVYILIGDLLEKH
jgi:hypothetical protein